MASIFLSHSSQDNEVAGDLSRRLKEHGYDSLFLDFDPDSGIKAGRDWERELYRNLKLARAVIVLCSPSSMTSRWCFVEIAQAKALGKAIFPITISPCQVETILNDLQVIDLTAVGADEAYRRLFDSLRASGLDPGDNFHWDPKRPPFPGLNYFDARDAGIYFGREDEVRQVIEKLTQMRRQGEPRLLVVVGSSGSGKSSLVRAGVLPRLGKDRSSWAVVEPFRPGAEPIRELAKSMFEAFPDVSGRPDWRVIHDRLRDESHAADTASMLTEYADDLTMLLGRRETSVLLVVDQAEELLQGGAGDEASAFLNVLRRATERPGGRVFALLTLRSDFLGSFQNHPALRNPAFADLPLGLLPVEHFPQVIEGPAERAEIALEPGLVGSMIADARTDDALPLLAFTLREMYERCRDQERLTLKVYRDDLGGIKGAVARVVERIKAESTWTPEVGRALRRAFLKLVRVNDEGQFTRQPCRWADLPDQAAPVLEAFVKARLLSSNGDVIEVTHESLFRVWPDLAGWLDEGRELILWRKNLQNEVENWIAHDRAPLYLLSGARVAEGRRWLASNADDFPGPEAEFIAASIAAEDGRIAREKSQRRMLRLLASCLAVAALGASAVGVYALIQRDEANDKANAAFTAEAKEKNQRLIAEKATAKAESQTRLAVSGRLSMISRAERDKRFDRSLLLAATAFQTENTIEARDSLFQALQGRPGLTSFLHCTDGYLVKAVFSPDGKTIAAGFEFDGDSSGAGGGLMFWDVATRKRLGDAPILTKKRGVYAVAFSPDGKNVAAGFYEDESQVMLWDVATRQKLGGVPFAVPEGTISSVAFSPDGKTIAAGYQAKASQAGSDDTGGIVVWDVATRKRIGDAPLAVPEGGVLSLAFSPDGKALAMGYGRFFSEEGGGLVIWDLLGRTRTVHVNLAKKRTSVTGMAFNLDGTILAAGFRAFGGVSGLVLWDVAGRKQLGDKVLAVAEGHVTSVAFSPDQNTLATGYSSGGAGASDVGGVVLWNLASRMRIDDQPLRAADGGVHSVDFSPDGTTLAAGYSRLLRDDEVSGVALLDLSAGSRIVDELLPLRVETGGYDPTFSPDGKTIAAGYYRGSVGVVLWDVAGRKLIRDVPFLVKESRIKGVRFSPDGKIIAAEYYVDDNNGGVALLDMAQHDRFGDAPLTMTEGKIAGIAFSPDGKTIAAGLEIAGKSILEKTGGVVLWDAVKRQRWGEKPLAVPEGGISGLAFSPDGKTIAAGYHKYPDSNGLMLWDVATRERIGDAPLPLREGIAQSVAFSPDGKILAAGYQGATVSGVSLWNVATWKRIGLGPIPVERGGVRDIAFSPDGKTIAAVYSAFNGTNQVGGMVLLNVATGSQLLGESFKMTTESTLTKLAFSPDGKSVVTGYTSSNWKVGGVVIWNVDLPSWVRRAGQAANRNFTRKEWSDYFPDTPYRATFPDLPIPPEEMPK
jgi:WD40 repeat protein